MTSDNASPIAPISAAILKIARRKTGAPAEKSEQAYGRTRHPGEKRKKLADSAVKSEVSTGRIEDSADRRTELAATRTLFAAERTYNVWVRTGLLALASGIGAKALLTGLVPGWLILANGSMLVLFSMFCFGAAVWRQLNPGLPPPIPTSPRISPALLVTINGFLALVSLFALFGVWFDRLPAP